ncbi:uncharacterized protein LOC113272862 [Papaver somniferum]|uniref:uncharacterized protein LOC113272862 n=1 Tax=Papaver somniferum TaxID=3469 RepID=UPI000E6F873A|nr:uncharacterized protein LOC113272862 [Papaver somniferum]
MAGECYMRPNSGHMVANTWRQDKENDRDSTPHKGPTATLSPRKSPRLIEKAKRTVGVSLTKMVLDFENHVEEPTQASSQVIVNLDDDSLGTEFWKSAANKVDVVEEAVNATKESVLHLQNLNADDCHPEDQPWSQPLIYSEGEDDADWKEFLHNFSMKSSAGKDSEEDDEDDHYDRLLETDDEVEVFKEVKEPLIDFEIENGKGKEIANGSEDHYGPEMVGRPLPNHEVRVVDNGQHWFDDSDFEDFLVAADSVDNELFPEPENEIQVVVDDRIDEGMEFPDKTAFKRHLRNMYLLGQNAGLVRVIILESRRVCKGFGEPILCPWYISARRIPGEATWSIRDFHLHHTCIGDPYGRNSCANPEFVAQHVINKLRESHVKNVPKPSEIAAEFWTSHNTLIPYHVAWKARNNVLERINGSFDESFRLIPSLCEMIKRTNPGSIATFTYGRDNRFESVTISFDAPMRGFINGCRNVVGLDGCHLKGKYGGCLLSATALDGQNGLVPLGIMVCRNECAENWFLFLNNLKHRLADHPVEPINFISDRQKGLRDAVQKLFPTSPHRFCFRHMYANFKMHYKGSKVHTLFWNAARAYKPKHFQAHMDSMMSENVSACQYLMGEDPKSWCRAFFDHKSACEHLSNNFSESFNNMITNIREKPICKLVLMYGQLVMGLFYKRRNACVGWDSGDLVPTAKKLLKKMFKKTGEYKVEGAVAGKLYEVTSIHNTIFTVDLEKHTCSCIQWQLRGFPCQHAVCALQQIRPNWVEYCARYYSVDNYRTTYSPDMVPLEGPEDWDEPRTIIVPPLLIRKPGRPRKNRRKAYNETLFEKKVRCCSKCKLPGHNKTTCPGGAIGSNTKRNGSTSEEGGLAFQSQSSSQAGSAGGSMPATKKPRRFT